jgi:hypothetical protein
MLEANAHAETQRFFFGAHLLIVCACLRVSAARELVP